MNNNNITPELIRAALAHIPATLPRDEWARIGMSIKSEFPNETGFTLFTDWSATADGFNPKATRATWKSIKAVGGVGIGTLLHLAKENGFVMPEASQAPSKPNPELTAQQARKRAASQQAERDRQQTAHEAAALEAQRQWNEASETGTSAYLARKGVQAYGVRFSSGGALFVPMRDAAGKLWNRQRIAPEKPANGGTDKLFQKGGRKSGLWHLISPNASVAPAVLLIAEGYATGASLHEATGYPVAVAFDAGNLVHVAKALRTLYPAALLVLCGDDDVQTLAQTGHNPGRAKATAAARAVGGLAVFPEGLPDGGSDFNDSHQVNGLEVVRVTVQAAIDAHQAGQINAQAAQSAKAGKHSQTTQQMRSGPNHGGDVDGSEATGTFDPFTVNDEGVWHFGIDKDGQRKSPMWICSRLEVEARTRDQDGGGWGYYLTFADPLGTIKQWAMPARMLSGDGGEYRATLLNMGLQLNTTAIARNLLTQYIQTRKPEEFAS